MSRILKRILLAIVGVLVLVIIALAVAPILFKDRLLDAARAQINNSVDAKVDFGDADLALLTTFPVFELGIDALTIDGVGPFEGERLLAVDRVVLGVDVWALAFSNRINITRVLLSGPDVRLRVDDEGRANYDIAKKADPAPPPTETSESGELALKVERYVVAGGNVAYQTPSMAVTVVNLNHEGRAELKGATQILASTTKASEVSAVVGGTTFVKKAQLGVDIDATIDGAQSQATLRTANVSVNALSLLASGTVGWGGPTPKLDVKARSNDDASIKGLLSLIPDAYTKDFARVSADGSFSLSAEVSGALSADGKSLPPLSVALTVKDGRFKYPDRSLDVKDIKLDAKLDHPGGQLDKAKIDVPVFGLRMGESFASAQVTATTVETAPTVDLKLDSRIALADVKAALPPEQVPDLSGTIAAQVEVQGPVSKPTRIEGRLAADDLAAGEAPAKLKKARIQLTTAATKIETLAVVSDNSDLNLSGTLPPVTAFMQRDAMIKGRLALRSKALVVDDFVSSDAASEKSGDPASPKADEGSSEAQTGQSKDKGGLLIPANVDAAVDVRIDRLTFGKLALADLKGKARVKDRAAILDGVSARGFGGRLSVKGRLVTSPDAPAQVELGYSVVDAGFRETYAAIGALETIAPIVKHLTGQFGSDLSLSAQLDPDGGLRLETLDADGFVATTKSKLAGFKPLEALAKAIPTIRSPLSIDGAKAAFTVEDGAVTLKEFPVRAGGVTLTVAGRHQLDQQMRYTVSTDVPVKKLGATSLAPKVKGLGVDVGALVDAKVSAVVTGSVDNPKVSFDVSLAGTGKAIEKVVEKKVDEAKKIASAKAKALISQARAKADQLKREAAKAAKKVEAEADQQAKKLEAEAKGNPFKKLAAQQGAKVIRRKGRDAAKKIIDEADAKAKKLIDDAEAEAKKLQ